MGKVGVGWWTKSSSSLRYSNKPPKIPVEALIGVGNGMASAQAALAAYLVQAYPNLSTNDIIKRDGVSKKKWKP